MQRYIWKLSSQSTSLSPSLIVFAPVVSLTMMFFSSTGSITGSMYSSKFSKRNGKPYCTASSSCFRKSASLNVFTLPSRSFPSRRLIQFTACICGSMQSANLLARVVRMPFCTDSSSDGRPSEAHCPVSTSLVRISSSLNGVVIGSSRLAISSTHREYVSLRLYSNVKAPAYDRKEEVSRQSPRSLTRFTASISRSAVQRVRSDARPEMSFSAATRRRSISSASSFRRFCSAVDASNFALSSASCSLSAMTAFFVLASSFSEARSVFSACATAARFGFTVRATAV